MSSPVPPIGQLLLPPQPQALRAPGGAHCSPREVRSRRVAGGARRTPLHGMSGHDDDDDESAHKRARLLEINSAIEVSLFLMTKFTLSCVK